MAPKVTKVKDLASSQQLESASHVDESPVELDSNPSKVSRSGEVAPAEDVGHPSLAMQTPGHPTEVQVEIHGNQESGTDEVAPESSMEEEQKRPRTVRFYSRVRITSGVGHFLRSKSSQRDRSNSPMEDGGDAISAPHTPIDVPDQRTPYRSLNSSASASYSSSISAPLRSSSEHPPRSSSVRLAKKFRAPLSDLLDATDTNAWLQSLTNERRKRNKKRRSNGVDERSPLLPQPARGILLHDPTNPLSPSHDNVIKMTTNESKWPQWLTLYYWEARLSALCCCEADVDE
ncbi:SubName: Full=Uncharacterized protein {ECO:0000313/EMBL:CCA69418.1} [Serendipita indica DSM 11827]|uniref:Uncharacterized protein n=1 Tax=Serendipita indica (strain DSM 11827) TaxID=1109443 RepID=G4TDL4_SERID|nr:SubName: Full=Uncharacterized protein {ECO:0000313/EMBL:CCA69418.1} [Serendipita indica DSM 11827]CCA69418.1 hypothetical protein PIIN_03318 [Serendipita indica DSM 11827]